MMADLNEDQLLQAASGLETAAGTVATVTCDVANLDQIRNAANETIEHFGKVHILMNNAGVSIDGSPGEIAVEDWRWIVDINLMGVVYGVEVFLPHIKDHGEGGYIVNTGSMGGFLPAGYMLSYSATKFAVIGYTGALKQSLESEGIGVSVLCPGFVKTNLLNSGDQRPSMLDSSPTSESHMKKTIEALMEKGVSLEMLAELTIDSMRSNRLRIFTAAEMIPRLDERNAAVLADYYDCLQFIEAAS